jgi:hypothetical protein
MSAVGLLVLLAFLGIDEAFPAAAVIAAAWVAWETRVLRHQGTEQLKNSASQLEMLKQQMNIFEYQRRLESVPDTFDVAIFPLNVGAVPEGIDISHPLSPDIIAQSRVRLMNGLIHSMEEADRVRIAPMIQNFIESPATRKWIHDENLIYVGTVHNLTDRSANDVIAAIFDPATQLFYPSPKARTTLRGGDSHLFEFYMPGKPEREFIGSLKTLFGEARETSLNAISGVEWPCFMMWFAAPHGEGYFFSREFQVPDTGSTFTVEYRWRSRVIPWTSSY